MCRKDDIQYNYEWVEFKIVGVFVVLLIAFLVFFENCCKH